MSKYDLSNLSDEELMALAQQGPKAKPREQVKADVAKMSDEELQAEATRLQKIDYERLRPKNQDDHLTGAVKFIGEGIKDGIFKMGEAVAMDVGDELTAGTLAAKDWLLDKKTIVPPTKEGEAPTDSGSFSDLYRGYLNASQRVSDEIGERSPVASFVGKGAGYVLGGGKAMKGAQALTGLGKVGAAATLGAAQGAASSEGNAFDDPIEVLKDAAVGGAIGGAAEKYVPVIGDFFNKLGKKVFSSTFGIAGKNVDAYLQRADDINAAKPIEDIKELIDQEVGQFRSSYELAKLSKSEAMDNLKRVEQSTRQQIYSMRDMVIQRLNSAKMELSDSFGNYKRELLGSKATVQKANEIGEILRGEKAILSEMSEAADDVLEQSGLVFEKKHLLRQIEKTGQSLGAGPKGRAIIGDEVVAAAMKLKTMYDRVDGAFGETIAAPELRAIMRQVRRDIGFDQSAGEFNTVLNAARKEFTESISGVLKDKIPEYKKIMDKMHLRSQALEKMDDLFGTPERALASLDAIASPTPTRKSAIVQDTLQEYVNVSGTKGIGDTWMEMSTLGAKRAALQAPSTRRELMNRLPEATGVRQAERTLERMTPRRIESAVQILTDTSPEAGRLQLADMTLENARARADRFSNFGPMSSESKIKQAMTPRGIENKKQIQELSQITGIDFTQMIGDRAVADAFEKGYMHGSRNVNLWSAVGAMFGGKALLGGDTPITNFLGAGAVFGSMIDAQGPKMGKKLMDVFLAVKNSKFATPLAEAAAQGPRALTALLNNLNNDQDFTNLIEKNTAESAVERRMRRGN